MDAQWTSQQVRALAAMNIPVWEKAPQSNHYYFYKVGSFYLAGQSQLPVELPQWFNDLCLYLGERPVAVKTAGPSDTTFNYDSWFAEIPTTTFKRELWCSLSDA